MHSKYNCCVESDLVIAIPAAKMAAPEHTRLTRENILKILKCSTLSSLAENTPNLNNLQNKIFRNLWLMSRDIKLAKT